MRCRTLLLLAPLLIVLCCGGGAPASPPRSADSPLLGKPAPTFARPSVQGQRVDTKDFAGKVVVVKFFAEYCKPCQKTLPAAEALRRERPDVVFIGIAEDETRDKVLQQIAAYGLSFPVIHDRGNVLAGRFRVNEMPATFVVGKGGKVAWVGGEVQDEADLGRAVEAASR